MFLSSIKACISFEMTVPLRFPAYPLSVFLVKLDKLEPIPVPFYPALESDYG